METPSTPSDRERGPDEAFCRNCGAVISDRAEICPECGVRQRPPPKSSVDSAVDDLLGGGNPFVAAVLSAVFPGVGQLYNRELGKGIALMAAGTVTALSMAVLVGFVLYPVVWVFAVHDAYRTAERQDSAADATAGAGGPDRDEAGRGGDVDVADADAEDGDADPADADDGDASRTEPDDDDADRTDARDDGAARRD